MKPMGEERKYSNEDFRTIRFLLGLNKTQFAKALGVSHQLVSFIENDSYNVSKRTNRKLYLTVRKYIDEETLNKILDGEIEI